MIDLKAFDTFFDRLVVVYEENEAYLTDLDSAIGDADHGTNMRRGFQAVRKSLAEKTQDSISALLKTVSMQLIKTVGGASGPLYGTFFLKASLSAEGKETLSAADFAAMLRAGVDGVVTLGKAQREDKTMIDTWLPAIQAMENALESQEAPIQDMLEIGLLAAKTGMDSTIDIVARKGRASYLGERSQGHIDPGAVSSYLLLKTAAETFARDT